MPLFLVSLTVVGDCEYENDYLVVAGLSLSLAATAAGEKAI